MEGSDRQIVVLGDYNLLSDCDKVVSALAPLCATHENEALRAMSDMELSRSVSGMALRVDIFLFISSLGLCY